MANGRTSRVVFLEDKKFCPFRDMIRNDATLHSAQFPSDDLVALATYVTTTSRQEAGTDNNIIMTLQHRNTTGNFSGFRVSLAALAVCCPNHKHQQFLQKSSRKRRLCQVSVFWGGKVAELGIISGKTCFSA
jgi:hypothetical protein